MLNISFWMWLLSIISIYTNQYIKNKPDFFEIIDNASLANSFYLVHIASGFVWSAVMLVFSIEHIQGKLDFFKYINKQLISGILQITAIITIAISGIILLLLTYRNNIWVNIHLYATFLIIVSSFLHIKFLKNGIKYILKKLN